MKRAVFGLLVVALVLSLVPLAVSAAPSNGGYTCVTYYRVKRGDYLSRIAARYGVSLRTLKQVNSIRNANKIWAGMRLCIPGTPKPPAKPKPPYHHPPSHPHQPPGYYPPPSHPHQPPGYYPPPPRPGEPPASCGIPVVYGFGRVYAHYHDVRMKLGCPTAPEDGFSANDQVFKNGYVVQNTDAKIIYVLFNNHQWEWQHDTWVEGEPINNPNLYPPHGWYQPEYGIGKMWRNVDNYSQRLGWARYPQQHVTATHQVFEHGKMIWTASHGIYVLYDHGGWQSFK